MRNNSSDIALPLDQHVAGVQIPVQNAAPVQHRGHPSQPPGDFPPGLALLRRLKCRKSFDHELI